MIKQLFKNHFLLKNIKNNYIKKVSRVLLPVSKNEEEIKKFDLKIFEKLPFEMKEYLKENNIVTPTEIQSLVIGKILEGKNILFGSQTVNFFYKIYKKGTVKF
jgi:superfamily II DNA/RNA helicase